MIPHKRFLGVSRLKKCIILCYPVDCYAVVLFVMVGSSWFCFVVGLPVLLRLLI